LALLVRQVAMEIDTTRTVDIRASAVGSLLPTFVLMAMTCFCVVAIVASFGTGDSRLYLALAGAVLFGAATLASIRNSVRPGQPVLTLSPEGFRDVRISREFVPWSVVESIWVSEEHVRRTVVRNIAVTIPESARNDARFGRTGDWSRMVRSGCLTIRTGELSAPLNDVLEMMQAYAVAHGGKRADKPAGQ
jgi:hypothetical protein